MPEKFRRYTLFAIPLLALMVVGVGLGFNGLYGQDPHYYFQYSQALTTYFVEGQKPLIDFFWPVLYPLTGAVPAMIGGSHAFWLQLASCLSICFAGLYCFKILNVLYPDKQKRIFWYVLLGIVASPYLLRSSLVVMSDALCVAFVVGTIYHVLQYNRLVKAKHVVFGAACIGAALMTRYAAAIILVVPGIFLLLAVLKSKKWLHLMYGLGFLAICLIPHILLKGENATRFLSHGVLGEWSILNTFRFDFVTSEGQLHYSLPNIVFGLFNFIHPGYFVMGIPTVIFLRKAHIVKRDQLMLCSMFLVYFIFVIGIPNQNTRFLLLSFPVAVLILFPAFDALAGKLDGQKNIKMGFTGVVMVAQVVLLVYVFEPFYSAQRLEQNIAARLDDYEADVKLYTFAMNLPMENYGVPQDVTSLYDSAIDDYDVGAMVLFAPERFAEQWADENPMRNWKVLNEKYIVEELEAFERGWKLYEISNKK